MLLDWLKSSLRRLIINQQPTDLKCFENISALLDELIRLRKTATQDYQAYLQQIVELSRQVVQPSNRSQYSQILNSPVKRALLVHLLERNHHDRFVALMNKFMPNWRFY